MISAETGLKFWKQTISRQVTSELRQDQLLNDHWHEWKVWYWLVVFISAGSNLDFSRRGITMAVFWDDERQPLRIETLHSRVRWGSSKSRHSLTRNVGAGSRSHPLVVEALRIPDISAGGQMLNESRLLSVWGKTGGGADAVADRMVPTFNSRNDRN